LKYLIAFIGFGEAAFHISNGLISEGLTNIIGYDVNQNDEKLGLVIRKRAEEARVNLVESLEVAYSSAVFIVSSTSAKVALSVAQSIIPNLISGQTYVDTNSAAPTVKNDIANIPHADGVMICDAAVMSTVPGNGHKVPMLLSGDGAKAFYDEFSKYGMNLTDLKCPAGGSSAIKMFRSVFMKGLPQIMIEAMAPAAKFGALDALVDSLNETMYGKTVEQMANTFIARTMVHARRRASEMKDVITTLEAMGLDASMSKSTEAKLEQLAEMNLIDKIGADGNMDYKEAIKLLI
jgi:3-hydroxyisobutyrate dehydrogenase-like beta-hydroxyacid dehydrogenase